MTSPRTVYGLYWAFSWLGAALNLAVAAGSIWLLVNAERLSQTPLPPDMAAQLEIDYVPIEMIQPAGKAFLPVGILFGIGMIILPFLPKTPKMWQGHLLNIALGLTSCCLTPFCLYLMLRWLKPDVRQMFGIATEEG